MGRSAVLRCSGSRTTYPTPLPSSTHPQPKTSRELGRGLVLKLGPTTLASDPGCVVAVWVEMEKDTLSDPLKEYQEKNVGHKFSG